MDPHVLPNEGEKKLKIVWPEWNKMINDSFIPLVDNTDRYMILYGGRGSAKSNFVAKLLIYRALTEKYFRCILIRKTYTSIRNSQYKTLKDLIQALGLATMFKFRTQPFEVECINGNLFVAAGMDEVHKLKSIKDPTCTWYEEDLIDEGDWITVTTSIRTTKARFLQEIFSINPEVEGDYREHWFFKKFFADWWREDNLSYSGMVGASLKGKKRALAGGASFTTPFTVHHSDHTHNRWLPEEFRNMLEDMKYTNPYYYLVYTKGMWGNKVLGGKFYSEYDRLRHSFYRRYRKDESLHISFDFNVHPYMSLIICQVVGSSLYIIDEIAASEPDNNTPNLCRLFTQKYQRHEGNVYIYGDPSGRAADTHTTQGSNQYSIIRKHLGLFKTHLRVDTKAPPVEMRGDFINEIFKGNFAGIRIVLDEKKCIKTIDDLMYCMKAADGTKFKQRTRNKETNITYELRGHFTDTLDYIVCRLFRDQWRAYKKGAVAASTFSYEVHRDARFGEAFKRW